VLAGLVIALEFWRVASGRLSVDDLAPAESAEAS